MNAEGLVSAGGLSKKIVSYLIVLCLDLFISVFVVFIDVSNQLKSDNNPNAPFGRDDEMIFMALSALQLVLHFVLIFWYFFLIWKTFMFRFGELKRLASYFPILYLAPLNFLFFVFERALRYVSDPPWHGRLSEHGRCSDG